MTAQSRDPAVDLRNLVADGSVSLDALSAMTGIEYMKLDSLLHGAASTGLVTVAADPNALTPGESLRVSTLSAQLSEGLAVTGDERVRSIYEALTAECRLTLDNLTRLTSTDTDTLRTILTDPEMVPTDVRYSLALRGSYLINAVNRARSQEEAGKT